MFRWISLPKIGPVTILARRRRRHPAARDLFALTMPLGAAAMVGTEIVVHRWISATGRAISSKSCRASANTNAPSSSAVSQRLAGAPRLPGVPVGKIVGAEARSLGHAHGGRPLRMSAIRRACDRGENRRPLAVGESRPASSRRRVPGRTPRRRGAVWPGRRRGDGVQRPGCRCRSIGWAPAASGQRRRACGLAESPPLSHRRRKAGCHRPRRRRRPAPGR